MKFFSLIRRGSQQENDQKFIEETNKRPTFCALPWMNLNSMPDGRVKLCCNINKDLVLKDKKNQGLIFGKDRLADIWNSLHMKKVRTRMLTGKVVSECEVCYRTEEQGGTSSRQMTNLKYLQPENTSLLENLRSTKFDGSVQKGPSTLELRLGNFCNLTCNSCNCQSSSSILAERKKMMSDIEAGHIKTEPWLVEVMTYEKEDWTKNYNWHESEKFHEDFKQIAPGLKRIYLTGGEPTLIKANGQITDELLASENFDCEFSFTTNLTTWNESFYKKIVNFKSVEIQVSIDGFGPSNDYIRNGSHWHVIEKHFQRLMELPPHVHVVVLTVLQSLNIGDLGKIFQWLKPYSETRKITWFPIRLDYPLALSVQLLPHPYRLQILKDLESVTTNIESSHSGLSYAHGLEEAIKFISHKIDEVPRFHYQFMRTERNQHKILMHYLDLLDASRGTNWRRVFPRIDILTRKLDSINN